MSLWNKEFFRFKGGVHPADDGKRLSVGAPLVKAQLLECYKIPVGGSAGKPPKVIVNVGDRVLKYQKIAEADGFVSAPLHSPCSGTVKAVIEVPGVTGTPIPAVEIVSDGLDEGAAPYEKLDWQSADPALLLERVREAGLVGMGGAAFPTAVKLSVPPGKKVDTLILNGSECEPYLTADHKLMAEFPERVLAGVAIIGKILNVERLFIGIENNKRDAVDALSALASKYKVKVVALPVRYPQGSEKQLIHALTGRHVPSGGLPADAGCVVQNVGTAAALSDAVLLGIPLIERIVTITGKVVKNPGNYLLRIGTPVMEALRLAGGVTEEPGKLIAGGPMMGFAQKNFDGVIAKNSSGLLLLPVSEAQNFDSSGCLRCGRCVRVCPMNLLPCLLCMQIESGRFDLAAQNHVMDCLECGACAYDCPAHRPLVQLLRRAKTALRKMRK